MRQNPQGFALAATAMGAKGKASGRGAAGFIPGVAGEVHDIKRGVGGVSPSSKPVTIPNFAFGGGMRGTMVANTGEYIVPNYSNGGSAIFNPNMVAQYGMPKGARPVRGSQGYVPNFAFGGDINRAITQLQGKSWGTLSQSQRDEVVSLTGRSAKTIQSQGLGASLTSASKVKKGQTARTYTSQSMAMFVPPQSGAISPFYQHNYRNLMGKGATSVRFPAYTYAKKPKGNADDVLPIKKNIEDAIFSETVKYARSIRPPAGNITKGNVLANLDSAQGGRGAISAAAGAAFEVGVTTALGISAAASDKGRKNLDIPLASPSLRAGGNLRDLFNQPATMSSRVRGGDFKISASADNVTSMADKITALDRRFLSWNAKRGAHGYVPNFAALGDAVEREAAAGVPLGSIRVSQSSRLSGPNNPAGLAVTNTRDEPRGLRDVVGASRGYVPNYAKSCSTRCGSSCGGTDDRDS